MMLRWQTLFVKAAADRIWYLWSYLPTESNPVLGHLPVIYTLCRCAPCSAHAFRRFGPGKGLPLRHLAAVSGCLG